MQKKRNQRTVRTSTKKILKSKREIKEKQYRAGQKSEKRERIRSRLMRSRKKNWGPRTAPLASASLEVTRGNVATLLAGITKIYSGTAHVGGRPK
jgi:hypothetical protein